jgi:hypothetical protein
VWQKLILWQSSSTLSNLWQWGVILSHIPIIITVWRKYPQKIIEKTAVQARKEIREAI